MDGSVCEWLSSNVAIVSSLQVVLNSPFDPYRWWLREELEDLTKACGLVDFECDIRSNFILFTARKKDSGL